MTIVLTIIIRSRIENLQDFIYQIYQNPRNVGSTASIYTYVRTYIYMHICTYVYVYILHIYIYIYCYLFLLIFE